MLDLPGLICRVAPILERQIPTNILLFYIFSKKFKMGLILKGERLGMGMGLVDSQVVINRLKSTRYDLRSNWKLDVADWLDSSIRAWSRVQLSSAFFFFFFQPSTRNLAWIWWGLARNLLQTNSPGNDELKTWLSSKGVVKIWPNLVCTTPGRAVWLVGLLVKFPSTFVLETNIRRESKGGKKINFKVTDVRLSWL